MKILIVDDNKTNLKLVKTLLELEGHRTIEALDGHQALDRLERETVDAVITDILMPRMDGYVLCHEIRKSQRFRNLPVIIYTMTYTPPSDERLALDVGADRYLRKPAPAGEIITVLREVTSQGRSPRRKQVRPVDELNMMKEYSAVLVQKLEEKNIDLEKAKEDVSRLNMELEQRVLQWTVQLEAANRELDSFSHSVSHDLRAPLRTIDGFSRMVLEEYSVRLDETGKGYLVRVRAAAQRMSGLIDDLIGFSRVTRSEMSHRPVNLTAMAKVIAAELQRSAPSRRTDIAIAEGLAATGDGGLFRVALENLMGNAWKFTSKRPDAKIEFGKIKQDGRTAYYVRDNGAGFDMAYADKLFGAFQRLHSTEEFEGTGIGLATVQRIIQRHGGRIWAEGAVDKGATFYFTFS